MLLGFTGFLLGFVFSFFLYGFYGSLIGSSLSFAASSRFFTFALRDGSCLRPPLPASFEFLVVVVSMNSKIPIPGGVDETATLCKGRLALHSEMDANALFIRKRAPPCACLRKQC